MKVQGRSVDWTFLDQWWSTFIRTQSIAQNSSLRWMFNGEQSAREWEELDAWWNAYGAIGNEAARKISDLIVEANEKWAASDAPFNTDPLAVDLTREQALRGPLHPRNEVEWSRWLAQLIRPSAALVAELFGMVADQPPREVVREIQLTGQDGALRRPDILLCYADRGISVEVKLDDENYRKTPDTAKLVERHYSDREWTHVLLLPKSKKGRLDSIVSPSLTTKRDGSTRIGWDDPGPVGVLYWCDVTSALRSLLLRGSIPDDHWAANAYLFCAVAEQRIMHFQAQPVIDRLASPTNAVDAIRPIGISDTLESQLTYLREGVGT